MEILFGDMNMKILDEIELMKRYAKKASKFCMYISWDDEWKGKDGPDSFFLFEDLILAAPYLKKYEKTVMALNSSRLVLIFNTEEEMEYRFNQTVGEDGPTILNNYDGIVRVYALTCSNEGELWSENT